MLRFGRGFGKNKQTRLFGIETNSNTLERKMLLHVMRARACSCVGVSVYGCAREYTRVRVSVSTCTRGRAHCMWVNCMRAHVYLCTCMSTCTGACAVQVCAHGRTRACARKYASSVSVVYVCVSVPCV